MTRDRHLHLIIGTVFTILLGGALMVLAGIGQDRRQKEITILTRQLNKAANSKISFCDGARGLTVTILYSFRHESTFDSGVFAAQQLGLAMRYCDGDQGTALAREIEDAIMDALPARYGGTRESVDVNRIEKALLTFKER